ncbi:universal stress protein [Halostagnicola bangensis]
MTLERILLAVGPNDIDRADEILETVLEVAKPTGATVILSHVFTEDEYKDVLEQLNLDTSDESVDADRVADRYAAVQDFTSGFEEADIEYEIRGSVGEHGEMIVNQATAFEADRVIVAGRTRSPVGKALFGSTAQTVLLSAPCPVTFVCSEN